MTTERAIEDWNMRKILTVELLQRIDEIENPWGDSGELPSGVLEGGALWFWLPDAPEPEPAIVTSAAPDGQLDRWWEIMATEYGSAEPGDPLTPEEIQRARFRKRWLPERPQ